MDKNEYIAERVDDQITWYCKKSGYFQKWHKRGNLAIVIASAGIPLLSGYLDLNVYMKIICGILGVIVTVLTIYLNLIKAHELWVCYRITAENLKREKFLYQTHSGVYQKNKGDRFQIFVRAIEDITATENVAWQKQIKKTRKKISK